MTRIGPCAATQNGDDGRSTRRGPDFAMALVPAEASETDHAPDLLVVAGDRGDLRQVGAGRQRIAGKAGATIAIPIDDPGLVQPLRANPFQADGRIHVLLWGRPTHRASLDWSDAETGPCFGTRCCACERRTGACQHSRQSGRAAHSADRPCCLCPGGGAHIRPSRALDLCRDPAGKRGPDSCRLPGGCDGPHATDARDLGRSARTARSWQ